MKLIFTTFVFAFGTLAPFVNAETQNSNTPITKRVSMTVASTTPIIDYVNGILSVQTSSTVNRVTVTIVDESGATIYRRTNPISSTTHSFSVSLIPGNAYTVTATINGIQYYDIIDL